MGEILIIKGANFSANSVGKITPTGKISIAVFASPSGGGSVTGGGSYTEGSVVTISATASTGYEFSKWNDGNTNATRQITVGSTSQSYTATFVRNTTDTLLLSSSDLNGATVSLSNVADWLPGVLAKALVERDYHLEIKYIYARLKSVGTFTLKEFTFADQDTLPTATGTTYDVVVDSSMLDTTTRSGVNDLYKIPVNITLNNTIVSFGFGASGYINNANTVGTDAQSLAGYWSKTKTYAQWVLTDDAKKPMAVGYEVK